MWMAGTPCPYLGKIGKAATEAWEDSEYKPPTLITTQRKNSDYLKPEEPQEDIDAKSKDKSGLAIFGGIAALLLLL
jgi:hypothetical protein